MNVLHTTLAPMRALTTPEFFKIIFKIGTPDAFLTEFIRVHSGTQNIDEAYVEAALTYSGTTPCTVQLLGENEAKLCAAAREIQKYNVAGIDLNIGCPMPKIFKKNVGGGLLRTPQKIISLVHTLRYAVETCLSVKTRLGFATVDEWDVLKNVYANLPLNQLTVHCRSVAQAYRGPAQWSSLHQRDFSYPVCVNGDILTVNDAVRAAEQTGCTRVMIGRGALKNPWIFRQIREYNLGQTPFQPQLGDVRDYIDALWQYNGRLYERVALGRMKGYLNYINFEGNASFLYQMRRACSTLELLKICDRFCC